MRPADAVAGAALAYEGLNPTAVLLFFEWRGRQELDAMAPIREWRRKRRETKLSKGN
jgi:hypothetical protein